MCTVLHGLVKLGFWCEHLEVGTSIKIPNTVWVLKRSIHQNNLVWKDLSGWGRDEFPIDSRNNSDHWSSKASKAEFRLDWCFDPNSPEGPRIDSFTSMTGVSALLCQSLHIAIMFPTSLYLAPWRKLNTVDHYGYQNFAVLCIPSWSQFRDEPVDRRNSQFLSESEPCLWVLMPKV